MGWLNWNTRQRNRGTNTEPLARTGSSEPMDQHPLSPEQVADLSAAWAELAAAVKESRVTGFHACSRGGKPWQEDPAAVQTLAATNRSVDAGDTATEGPAAK